MLTFLQFTQGAKGKTITAPEGIGGTCVDLANEYLRLCLNLPHVYANAVDWAGLAIHGLSWIANTPHNKPPSGAIVVWGPAALHGIGPNGHIAVAVDADLAYIITFDQNWPTKSPCAFVEHDYLGVRGWHVPQPS